MTTFSTPSDRAQFSPATKWLGLFALWTIPGLPSLLGIWLDGPRPTWPPGPTLDSWGATLSTLFFWYLWVPLTPWIAEAGRRFPLWVDGAIHGFSLVFHGVASLVAGVVAGLFGLALQLIFLGIDLEPMVRFWHARPAFLFADIWSRSAIYWIVLLVALGWHSQAQASERQHQLTEARMTALRAQIHPHFLFNTLNSVSTLMEEDVAAARRTIAQLGQLLRASLDAPPGDEVTLDEELGLARLYLEIERARFEDRLEIRFDIQSSARDVAVPHLLLQPLVENAVRHGIGGRSAAGSILVRARAEGGFLRIDIEDDGPGPGEGSSDSAPSDSGIGLANVRERLEQLHGDAATVELSSRPGGGCLCAVRLPARRIARVA